MMSDQRELFEAWLAHMDDALDSFKASLPIGLASRLDQSVESLDLLEQHYLSVFPTVADALKPDAKLVLDGYTRYVGETIRTLINSKWGICLTDPKNAYFGLPTLGNNTLCPLTLVTTAADRRTGEFWSTIAKNRLGANKSFKPNPLRGSA